MNFEEVQKAINEKKELQILNYNDSWDWKDFKYDAVLAIKPEHIFSSRYRLKKGKVKRYQILYRNIYGSYFLTDEKYATLQEFKTKHTSINYHPGLSWGNSSYSNFPVRLIEETEEQFDE